ncbi:hypothetical protein S40288_10999 [Stachybotrys chartarum IBT 40288]|nr:hypothetical protein S40288_10999 [Stachybotrys chartarum IBT 40288]
MRFPCGTALLRSVLLAYPGPWLHRSKFFKRAMRPARGATDSYMTPMGRAPGLPKEQTVFWQRPPMAPTHQHPPVPTHPPMTPKSGLRLTTMADRESKRTQLAGCSAQDGKTTGSHRLQSSRDLSTVAARPKANDDKSAGLDWSGSLASRDHGDPALHPISDAASHRASVIRR